MSAMFKISVACWIKRGDKFLLQKRSEKENYGGGKWCTVGGKVEKGESVLGALFREVKEETDLNLDVTNVIILTDYVFPTDIGEKIVIVFVANCPSGKCKSNDNEELKWVDINSLSDIEFAFDTMQKEVALIKELKRTTDKI